MTQKDNKSKISLENIIFHVRKPPLYFGDLDDLDKFPPLSKTIPKEQKDNWNWLCICPHCQTDFTLSSDAPFLREKYKCSKCKKSVSGIFMRGYCEQVKKE